MLCTLQAMYSPTEFNGHSFNTLKGTLEFEKSSGYMELREVVSRVTRS